MSSVSVFTMVRCIFRNILACSQSTCCSNAAPEWGWSHLYTFCCKQLRRYHSYTCTSCYGRHSYIRKLRRELRKSIGWRLGNAWYSEIINDQTNKYKLRFEKSFGCELCSASMPGKMIIWCQFYSEILWKGVHVIPKTEVAEYRHLRKVHYLNDNVLTSIIPPPPKKINKK